MTYKKSDELVFSVIGISIKLEVKKDVIVDWVKKRKFLKTACFEFEFKL
jgi:hypothetical protein